MNGKRWFGGVMLAAALAIPAFAADEAAPPTTTTDASQGFVTFKSGDNALTVGAWGQFRVTIDDKDEFDNDTAGTGLGQADGTSVAFSVHKLRPYILGTVYKPWLKYKFEFELGPLSTTTTNNINNARITDAFITTVSAENRAGYAARRVKLLHKQVDITQEQQKQGLMLPIDLKLAQSQLTGAQTLSKILRQQAVSVAMTKRIIEEVPCLLLAAHPPQCLLPGLRAGRRQPGSRR